MFSGAIFRRVLICAGVDVIGHKIQSTLESLGRCLYLEQDVRIELLGSATIFQLLIWEM